MSNYLRHGDLVIFQSNNNNEEYLSANDTLQTKGIDISKNPMGLTKLTLTTHISNMNDKNRDKGYSGFFMDCIFEIVAGVGHESAGEPVLYGSVIRIALKRSSALLSSNSENNLVLLTSKHDLKGHIKDSFFRIKTRYKIRSEGERVYYEDVFILEDSFGRSLSLSKSTDKDVIVDNDKHNRCIFHAVPYVKFGSCESKSLIGGTFIKLFHKEDSYFLTFKRQITSTESNNKFFGESENSTKKKEVSFGSSTSKQSIFQFYQEAAHLDDSSGIWQIESCSENDLIISNSNSESLHYYLPMGVINLGHGFRLRHLGSDMYLCCNKSAKSLELIVGRDESTIFDFVLLPSMQIESSEINGIENTVSTESLVRIHNKSSNSYITLKEHKNHTLFVPSNEKVASSDYYQIKTVAHEEVDDIVFSRLVRKSLLHYTGRLQSLLKSLTPETILQIQSCSQDAINILKIIYYPNMDIMGNKIKRKYESFINDNLSVELLSNRQNTLLEFGIIKILLDFANQGIIFAVQSSQYESKQTSTKIDSSNNYSLYGYELAYYSYITIKSLVLNNYEVAVNILELDGMKQLIRHIEFGETFLWNHVIFDIVNAYYSNTTKDKRRSIVLKTDLKAIFNYLLKTIVNNIIPSNFCYELLSIICNNEIEIVLKDSTLISTLNFNIQTFICENLLGLVDEMDGYSVNNSLFFFQCFNGNLSSNELFISTCSFSRSYPPNSTLYDDNVDPVVKRLLLPNGIAKVYIPETILVSLQQIDDIILLSDAYQKVISSQPAVNMDFQNSMITNIMNNLPDERLSIYKYIVQDVIGNNFKALFSLNLNESKYFCSMLKLFVSLCKGRNMICQRIIRQVIPLNFILIGINSKIDKNISNELLLSYVSIKSQLFLLLNELYVNSSYLSDVSSNPTFNQYTLQTTSLINTIPSSTNSNNYKTFDQIYSEECHNKVFSLVTQYNEENLFFSNQLNDKEIIIQFKLVIDFISKNQLQYNFTLPEDNLKQLIHLLTLSYDERSKIVKFLYYHKYERMKYYASLNNQSIKQRKFLLHIIEDYLSNNVEPFLLHTDSNFYGNIDKDTEKLSDSNDNDNMSNYHLKSIGLSMSMELLKSVLLVIKSLQMRKFFDPLYNNNPKYIDNNLSYNSSTKINQSINYFYTKQSDLLDIQNMKYKYSHVKSNQSNDENENSMVTKSRKASGFDIGKTLNLASNLTFSVGSNTSHITKDKLNNIVNSMFTILTNLPYSDINVFMKTSFDEDQRLDKELKIYYNYIQNNNKRSLVNDIISILMLCLNILSNSYDIIQFNTIEDLYSLIETARESVGMSKNTILMNKKPIFSGNSKALTANGNNLGVVTSGIVSGIGGITSGISTGIGGVTSGISSGLNVISSGITNLINDDLLTDNSNIINKYLLKIKNLFQSTMTKSLDNNSNELKHLYIWDIETLYFSNIDSIIKLFYYCDNPLRSLILQMLYRYSINSNELTNLLMSSFNISDTIGSKYKDYLSIQSNALELCITSFWYNYHVHECFYKLYAHKSDKHLDISNDINISMYNQLYKLKNNYLRLILVLDNYDKENGLIGLIQFCLRDNIVENPKKDNSDEIESADKVIQSKSIFSREISKRKQSKLRVTGIHKIIIQFLSDYNLTSKSSTIPNSYSKNNDNNKTDIDLLIHETINLQKQNIKTCIQFLRIYIKDNIENASTIDSPEIISLLIQLQIHSTESQLLLNELLLLSKSARNRVGIKELMSIFDDVKNLWELVINKQPYDNNLIVLSLQAFAIWNNLIEFGDHSYLVSLSIRMIDSLARHGLLKHIVRYSYDSNILHDKTEDSHQITIDVNNVCVLYKNDTERATYSRNPVDILKDVPITYAYIEKLLKVVNKWKLLSNNNFLKVSLSCVETLSLILEISNDSDNYSSIKSIIGLSSKSILLFLMVDKHEVRFTFLKLLKGYLFNGDCVNFSFLGSMFSQENILYSFALFYSLLQDLKIFAHIYNNLNTINKEYYYNQCLYENIELINKYMVKAVLPFISRFVKYNCLSTLKSLQINTTYDLVLEGSVAKHSLDNYINEVGDILKNLNISANDIYFVEIMQYRNIITGSNYSIKSIDKFTHPVIMENNDIDESIPLLSVLISNYKKKNYDKQIDKKKSIFTRNATIYSETAISTQSSSQNIDENATVDKEIYLFIDSTIKIFGSKHQLYEYPSDESNILDLNLLGAIGNPDVFKSINMLMKRKGDFNIKSYKEQIEIFNDLRLRWSKDNAKAIELILSHISNSLSNEIESKTTTLTYSYWLKLITSIIEKEMKSNECLIFYQNSLCDIGACQVVVRSISSIHEYISNDHNKPLSDIHIQAFKLGIALLETGNSKIQNKFIEIIESEKDKLIDGSGKYFMLSVRTLLYHFTYYLSRSYNNKDHMDYLVEGIELLMRFLTLLCEGHNNKSQLYLFSQGSLGSTNVVTEVAAFAQDVMAIVSSIIKDVIYTKDEIRSNEYPHIYKMKRDIINWTKRNIFTLTPYSKLLQCTFDALSEMTQGPCAENQLAIARTGLIGELSILFSFFGSLQTDIELRPDQHVIDSIDTLPFEEWKADFSKKLGYNILYDNKVSKIDSRKVFWKGNDPVVVELVLQQRRGLDNQVVASIPLHLSKHLVTNPSVQPSRNNSYDEIDINQTNINSKRIMIDNMRLERDEYIQYIKSNQLINIDSNNIYLQINQLCNDMYELEKASLKFLSSLLEGNLMENDDEIPKTIIDGIDTTNLLSNCINYWNKYINLYCNNINIYINQINLFDEYNTHESKEFQLAFEYYSIVMTLCDLQFSFLDNMRNTINKWIIDYNIPIDSNIARIEIQGQVKQSLIVVYFPIPFVVRKYWKRSEIVEFRENIVFPDQAGTRDSVEEKIKSFIESGKDLIRFLGHIQKLDQLAVQNKIFVPVVNIAKNFSFWSWVTFLIAIGINLYLLTPYGVLSYGSKSNMSTLLILGSMNLSACCVAVFSYSLMYGVLYIQLGYENNPKNQIKTSNNYFKKILLFLYRFRLFGKDLNIDDKVLVVTVSKGTMTLIHFCSRPQFLYYSALLVFSVLARFISPLFYACCLIEVLRVSKSMQYVTRSFTNNIGQVLASLTLGALIIYLFVVSSFTNHKLHNYALNGQYQGCDTLNACFRLHLDYGITNPLFWVYSGHIPDPGSELYNFLFTFIVQIVLPGIVSGIIIDTFASLREATNAMKEDVYNTCFICNIDREDFESANIEFSKHIQHDHNMWKYLWYIIYLEEKESTEFSGIEQFCFKLSEEDNFLRWLPIKIARALRTIRDKYDLRTIFSKITKLQGDVNNISNTLMSITKQQDTMSNQLKNQSLKIMKSSSHNQLDSIEKDQENKALKDVRKKSINKKLSLGRAVVAAAKAFTEQQK